MTETVQPKSSIMLCETDKNSAVKNIETEEYINKLNSVYDNLNNLSNALTRMDRLWKEIYEKLLEKIIYKK